MIFWSRMRSWRRKISIPSTLQLYLGFLDLIWTENKRFRKLLSLDCGIILISEKKLEPFMTCWRRTNLFHLRRGCCPRSKLRWRLWIFLLSCLSKANMILWNSDRLARGWGISMRLSTTHLWGLSIWSNPKISLWLIWAPSHKFSGSTKRTSIKADNPGRKLNFSTVLPTVISISVTKTSFCFARWTIFLKHSWKRCKRWRGQFSRNKIAI